MMKDQECVELLCEIGRRVYARGYVAANDGNFSVKCSPTELWCTPTGVSKGFMTPDMMVKMNLDGEVLEGTYAPSSEMKMHLRVYQENEDIQAIVHAHPAVATSYAIAGIPLERPILPEAIMNLGRVPVTNYATPGTQEVPDSVAPFCRDYNAVLLANHGALTWGRDLMEAYFRMETLEHYATILMYTGKILGQARELTQEQISQIQVR